MKPCTRPLRGRLTDGSSHLTLSSLNEPGARLEALAVRVRGEVLHGVLIPVRSSHVQEHRVILHTIGPQDEDTLAHGHHLVLRRPTSLNIYMYVLYYCVCLCVVDFHYVWMKFIAYFTGLSDDAKYHPAMQPNSSCHIHLSLGQC